MKSKQLFAIVVLAGTVGVASAEGQGPGLSNLQDEAPMVVVKTRAQVQAELAEARRQGLVVYGETDAAQNVAAIVTTKTRAEVQAELTEARRLGLVVFGEADIPVTTPEQEREIVEAGRRAVAREVAAK
jgi:hypothetical protein